MRILQVACDTAEWLSARELRFSLFFDKAGLPRSVMDDHLERSALHFVSTEHGCVTGCVRLFTEDGLTWSISQLAVDPSCQGKGAGTALLQVATAQAEKAGAARIVLNARLTAIGFYARSGFATEGKTFLSEATGVPHILMVKEVERGCRSAQ